jgi:hypothetical protein
VNGKADKGYDVEHGNKKRAEESADDGTYFSMIAIGNSGSMDQNKKQDEEPAIDHGAGSLGVLDGPFFNFVSLVPGLAVLEEEQDPGDYMYGKDQKQSLTEYGNYQGVAVQLVSIGLKQCYAGKECRVTGCMAAEEKE